MTAARSTSWSFPGRAVLRRDEAFPYWHLQAWAWQSPSAVGPRSDAPLVKAVTGGWLLSSIDADAMPQTNAITMLRQLLASYINTASAAPASSIVASPRSARSPSR